ncbi:MAG: hypothetical protein IPK26_00890 [Planctomycetes bacterium]|nr:hypothetical protein [Planctomycetota bacterium]
MFEQRRDDLLAITSKLNELIEGGAKLPAFATALPQPSPRLLTIEDVPADKRVSFAEAVAGVKDLVPGLDLPSCPERTMRSWVRQNDSLLGVVEVGKRKSPPSELRPLVRGLLVLHGQRKRRIVPPQRRVRS